MATKKKTVPKKTTLISPQAMGGIYGGEGFTFQDRYIVCHIPVWLADPKFVKLMPEGAGDVDVVFAEGRKHFYDHIQIKDHHVDNSEFVGVLNTFNDFEKTTKKVYRKYVLTCPAVSPQIKSFAEKLKRYRELANNLYDPASKKALQSTKQDLKKVFDKFNANKLFKFVLDKVHLEVSPFDFHNNTVCKRQFAAALTDHPKYKEKFEQIIRSAYAHMITEVLAHRGKVLPKNKIQSLINAAIVGNRKAFKTIVLHIHNWELRKFETKPDVSIDWTTHFDRSTKKVPDQIQWNNDLIPQLVNAKKELATKSTNRQILFRGQCALSTSIALGMIFPEIGNWTFELMQPPMTDPWRSDAEKIKDYKLTVKEIIPKNNIPKNSSEIALAFSITGKAVPDVSEYFDSNAIPLKRIISIEPEQEPGNFAIQNDSEAVSLAAAAKDLIKQMITKYRATKTHLFYFGPAGLAVFLGQKLTSVGQIQLYEFQNPGYKPSCLLKS
ncbi:MAG: SAVED domain-containing protein [Ferruginibacter sp.]